MCYRIILFAVLQVPVLYRYNLLSTEFAEFNNAIENGCIIIYYYKTTGGYRTVTRVKLLRQADALRRFLQRTERLKLSLSFGWLSVRWVWLLLTV